MAVYGIDFGTCYSCLAVAEEGKEIKVLPTRDNRGTLPSVVEFRLKKDGTPRVCDAAKRSITPTSRNVAAFLKSEMDQEASTLEYEVSQGERRHISPVEFAACIYRELYGYANTQRSNNQETTSRQAVITVPAVCSELQREKTKAAAEAAGLEVLKIINEPTAAAISYNIGVGETILVFDLGGGTHDVSIVQRRSENDYQVLASEGNPHLGGKLWDEKLVELTWQKAGLAFTPDVLSHPRLIEFESHKINLCQGDDVTFAFMDDTGIQHQVTIDLELFEDFTQQLVEKAIDVATRAVAKAKEHNSSLKIDRICMAGGTCHMNAIKRALTQAFPLTPVALTNPDGAIASGAAQLGLSLVQQGGNSQYDLRITERGHAYGIKVVNSQGQCEIENFIMRNDPLVIQSRTLRRYKPTTSNSWNLAVFENNIDLPAFAFKGQKPFFSADLTFDRTLLVSTPLDVSFQRDANGLVHITVMANGKKYNYDFATTAGSISDEILQRVQHLIQQMNATYEYV